MSEKFSHQLQYFFKSYFMVALLLVRSIFLAITSALWLLVALVSLKLILSTGQISLGLDLDIAFYQTLIIYLFVPASTIVLFVLEYLDYHNKLEKYENTN